MTRCSRCKSLFFGRERERERERAEKISIVPRVMSFGCKSRLILISLIHSRLPVSVACEKTACYSFVRSRSIRTHRLKIISPVRHSRRIAFASNKSHATAYGKASRQDSNDRERERERSYCLERRETFVLLFFSSSFFWGTTCFQVPLSQFDADEINGVVK